MDLTEFFNFCSFSSPPSWLPFFKQEAQKYYFQILTERIKNAYAHTALYPPPNKILAAFSLTPLNKLRGTLLGQDPYHGQGQACGLAFSVSAGIKAPPSLKNIYKELKNEYPCYQTPSHGDLSFWAKQGLLLLNSVLTVEAGKPASCSRWGWQTFTDAALTYISRNSGRSFFFLWGGYAQKKAAFIDAAKHMVFAAAHPSPLARGAFFGCGCFKQANAFLTSQGKGAIDWQLPL